MLDRLDRQQPDALLAIIKAFANDTRLDKIDLGVGVYRTEAGATPVFASIKAAERKLWAEQDSKGYLGPEGDLAFVDALVPHLFGKGAGSVAGRVAGMQTPGGTGAVRLALAVAKAAGAGRVHLGTPSWPNHAQIIEDLGLEVAPFDHVGQDGRADAERVLSLIAGAAPRDVIVLHGCCHNPTGRDYMLAQWEAIAAALARSSVLPVLDVAYHGLGHGFDEDIEGVRRVLAAVSEAMVCYSCDKNFGMYRDRVGALYVLAEEADARARAISNASAFARATWSMPPDHGAAAVRIVLSDKDLTQSWQDEVASMRGRLQEMRHLLASAGDRAPGLDLHAVADGNGLFAMLPVSPDQVARLREEHGVYMAASGRINVAGLTRANIDKFVDALAAVTGR
jgi:aromatic-amino-acid transaminase